MIDMGLSILFFANILLLPNAANQPGGFLRAFRLIPFFPLLCLIVILSGGRCGQPLQLLLQEQPQGFNVRQQVRQVADLDFGDPVFNHGADRFHLRPQRPDGLRFPADLRLPGFRSHPEKHLQGIVGERFFQKGVEDLHEGRVVDIFGKQIALGEADFFLPDRLLDLFRKPYQRQNSSYKSY